MRSTVKAIVYAAGARPAAVLNALTRHVRPGIRVLNFHGLARADEGRFRSLLEALLSRENIVDPAVLHQETTAIHRERPFVLSFDDGIRSQAAVIAPILDDYGLSAIFAIPSAFPDVPAGEQVAFARAHRIQIDAEEGPRVAMTWDEIRELADRHMISSHTATHHRFTEYDDLQTYMAEVYKSREVLSERVGQEIRSFTWVGGEESTYIAAAATHVQLAGYEIAFTTNHRVHRVAENPSFMYVDRTHGDLTTGTPIDLRVSPLMDLYYSRKRRRIRERFERT